MYAILIIASADWAVNGLFVLVSNLKAYLYLIFCHVTMINLMSLTMPLWALKGWWSVKIRAICQKPKIRGKCAICSP